MITNKRKMQSKNRAQGDFMQSEEAMKLMQISRATFYRLAREGKIPGAVKVGSTWRIIRRIFWSRLENRASN